MVVNVVGELHEPDTSSKASLDPPGQVRRVDRQAVATDSWPRREPHVSERLGRGRVDGRPDVYAEVMRVHRKLVHEGNVYVPEGVLQQLRELGFLAGGRSDSHLDKGGVEALHRLQRGGVDAGHDLGCVPEVPGRVARVDPLRAIAEVEVCAGQQSGTLL